jgi:hypothetical protein
MMKSGQSDKLPNNIQAVMLSLLTVFCENVYNTSRIYCSHRNALEVNATDVQNCLKYEMLDPDSSGKQVLALLKEIGVQNVIDTTDDAKKEILSRASKYVNVLQESFNQTEIKQSDLVNDMAIGTFGATASARETKEEPATEEEIELWNAIMEEADEDAENSCDCEVCVKVRTAVTNFEFWEPTDRWEEIAYNSVLAAV